MGNQQTKPKETKSTNQQNASKTGDKNLLFNIVDTIATDLILTQQFEHMKKLDDMEYCNDLVILTSDILSETFNTQQINYLNQRITNGIILNEMAQDDIAYIYKKNMDKLGLVNKTKKQRICIGISKFYIKIAHLYYAIVSTLKPEYSYTDKYGNKQNTSFLKRKYISKESREKSKIDNVGLCYQRLNTILLNELKNVENKVEEIEVKNNVCKMNTKHKIKDGYRVRQTKDLIDEPGIPELKKLYYDVFDYTTNNYIGMSEKSKQQYKQDVELFYKVFTGKQEVPKEVENFSDIKLKDFYHHSSCKKDSPLNQTYKVKANDPIIANYAKQNAEIMATIERKQNKLIDILEEVFIYQVDKETQERKIIIHPRLTMNKLDQIVERARNIIIDLYVGCENDFMKLLKIFETLVEKQILLATEMKMKQLQQEKQKLLSEF